MTPFTQPHQYIERQTGKVVTEKLIGDAMVAIMYSSLREHAPSLFKALTSARVTRLLGLLNYDWSGMNRPADTLRLAGRLGIELHECVEPPESLNTARRKTASG